MDSIASTTAYGVDIRRRSIPFHHAVHESSAKLTSDDNYGLIMETFPERSTSTTSVETRRAGSLSQIPTGWEPSNCKAVARIVINVGGRHFDVPVDMLRRYPETLLGNQIQLQQYYVPHRDEYYFNRSRECFEHVVLFYQNGGVLRRHKDIALEDFIAEAMFFQLGTAAIIELCSHEGFHHRDRALMPTNPAMRRIWRLFEVPESSRAAELTAIFSMVMIVVSIVAFCLGTVPGLSQTKAPFAANVTYVVEHTLKETPTTLSQPTSLTINSTEIKIATTDPDEIKLIRGYSQFKEPLFVLEAICVAWFTLEFVLRLIACPSKAAFFKSLLNLIDILSIAPFYVDLAITVVNIAAGRNGLGAAGVLAALRSLRLVRVFRVFKLTRHFSGLQTLALTFRASVKELGLLLLFLSLGVLLFSTAAYYAEQGQKRDQFNSIPDSFWWAIVTMTTVGYGDVAPTGVFGKVVGALCAISGVIAVALPVPVIVNNFSLIYEREKERPRIEEILDYALATPAGEPKHLLSKV